MKIDVKSCRLIKCDEVLHHQITLIECNNKKCVNLHEIVYALFKENQKAKKNAMEIFCLHAKNERRKEFLQLQVAKIFRRLKKCNYFA